MEGNVNKFAGYCLGRRYEATTHDDSCIIAIETRPEEETPERWIPGSADKSPWPGIPFIWAEGPWNDAGSRKSAVLNACLVLGGIK